MYKLVATISAMNKLKKPMSRQYVQRHIRTTESYEVIFAGLIHRLTCVVTMYFGYPIQCLGYCSELISAKVSHFIVPIRHVCSYIPLPEFFTSSEMQCLPVIKDA